MGKKLWQPIGCPMSAKSGPLRFDVENWGNNTWVEQVFQRRAKYLRYFKMWRRK